MSWRIPYAMLDLIGRKLLALEPRNNRERATATAAKGGPYCTDRDELHRLPPRDESFYWIWQSWTL